MMKRGHQIFIHVPKTGGTSVRRVLQANGFFQGAFYHRPYFAEGACGPAFGFMRNPWERMVSYYRFMCQKPAGPNDHKVYKREAIISMGFKDWVMHAKFGAEIDKSTGVQNSGSVHRRPQMWWLRGVDEICLFENLDYELRRMGNWLGFEVGSLPHARKSTGRDWRLEYDGELVDFVANVFSEDIEFGEYKFDKLEIA